MKKQYIIMAALLLTVLSVAGGAGQAQAAKKSAVKISVKKGTLTVSGRGAMPAKFKVKNKKKVKKVVIKKGVTSIPDNAFKNYRNLKSAVIPKSVKKIGRQSFYGTSIKTLTVPSGVKTIGQDAFSNMPRLDKLTIPGSFSIQCIKSDEPDERSERVCSKAVTVAFNTSLNRKRTAAVASENFIVSKKDSKYKSIDGVIYSKDGKSLVRAPFLREELVIDANCEHLALQSILDSNVDLEGDPFELNHIKKIVIPPSVKKVESSQYAGVCRNEGYLAGEETQGVTLEIRSKQLDGDSLNQLIIWLGADPQEMMKQLPEQIYLENQMYISKDGVVLKYVGSEKEITVPSGVRKIGSYAFYRYNAAEKINLPEGLTEIEEYALYNCSKAVDGPEFHVSLPSSLRVIGDSAFGFNSIKTLALPDSVSDYGTYVFSDNPLTDVTLPEHMVSVPEGIFAGCGLKKIVIPDSVVTIGKNAFHDCSYATSIQFGNSVREIGEGAFCRVKFTSLSLPASVVYVGDSAFTNDWDDAPKSRKITVAGSSKGFGNFAFCTPEDSFTYQKSDKEMRTFFDTSYGSLKNLKAKISFCWNKVEGAGGYEAVFSTDKNFKKNKKTVVLKKSQKKKAVTVKVKKSQIKKPNKQKTVAVYGKIRPYKVVKGKKVYGRWTVNTFQCDEY